MKAEGLPSPPLPISSWTQAVTPLVLVPGRLYFVAILQRDGDRALVSMGGRRFTAELRGQFPDSGRVPVSVREATPERIVLEQAAPARRDASAPTSRAGSHEALLERIGLPVRAEFLACLPHLIRHGHPITAESLLSLADAWLQLADAAPEALPVLARLQAEGLPLVDETIAAAQRWQADREGLRAEALSRLARSLAELSRSLGEQPGRQQWEPFPSVTRSLARALAELPLTRAGDPSVASRVASWAQTFSTPLEAVLARIELPPVLQRYSPASAPQQPASLEATPAAAASPEPPAVEASAPAAPEAGQPATSGQSPAASVLATQPPPQPSGSGAESLPRPTAAAPPETTAQIAATPERGNSPSPTYSTIPGVSTPAPVPAHDAPAAPPPTQAAADAAPPRESPEAAEPRQAEPGRQPEAPVVLRNPGTPGVRIPALEDNTQVQLRRLEIALNRLADRFDQLSPASREALMESRAALHQVLETIDAQHIGNLRTPPEAATTHCYTMSIPINWSGPEDSAELRVHYRPGRRKRVDPSNVHLAFRLSLESLGTVAIDLRVFRRLASCSVRTASDLVNQLALAEAPSLQAGLEKLGYQVTGIRCSIAGAQDQPGTAEEAVIVPQSLSRVDVLV